MTKSHQVTLVNEHDEVVGYEEKESAHHDNTKLHRGCSLFLFNNKQELLIQKRSNNKKTWPSFWSNSCCGHPQKSETYEDAVKRCAKLELGISLEEVSFVAPYKYRFVHNNIAENEICHLYYAISNQIILPNFYEIMDTQWINWSIFLSYIQKNPTIFTPWCIEEAQLVMKSPLFETHKDVEYVL